MNYRKLLITKKKDYVGILQDGSKEPVIKGMEGIKSDRPLWINKIERRFADDIKYGNHPVVNILREYKAMGTGLVQIKFDLSYHSTKLSRFDVIYESRNQYIVWNKWR